MKQAPRYFINYIIFAVLFMGASILIGKSVFESTGFLSESQPSSAVVESESQSYIFVIDAGHGGEDGGASAGEILEKDLNLEISQNIADLCTVLGVNHRMTRVDDRLLYDYYDDLEDYKGKKKTFDLRNRLRIAEESSPELFISVHMNKFPESKYKGLQVYYSTNDNGSEEAAKKIQTYAKKYLSPENERQIKPANQSIYLLKRMKLPAVLVECGFLSNPEETELFKTREYREKTAAVIFASAMEYVGGK